MDEATLDRLVDSAFSQTRVPPALQDRPGVDYPTIERLLACTDMPPEQWQTVRPKWQALYLELDPASQEIYMECVTQIGNRKLDELLALHMLSIYQRKQTVESIAEGHASQPQPNGILATYLVDHVGIAPQEVTCQKKFLALVELSIARVLRQHPYNTQPAADEKPLGRVAYALRNAIRTYLTGS